jgi:hypothetical protein
MAGTRSGLKIALIIVGICMTLGCVVVLLCVGSGYFWVQNKVPEMREAGQRANDQAIAFAQGHTQSDCIDEGFRRHDACGAGIAMMCRTETRIFLERCLVEAAPTPGTCEGVPGPREFMEGARWSRQYCLDHGHGSDEQCVNFVRGLIDHCARVAQPPPPASAP